MSACPRCKGPVHPWAEQCHHCMAYFPERDIEWRFIIPCLVFAWSLVALVALVGWIAWPYMSINL